MKTFKRIVKELTKKKKTISTMESCTGGGVVNEITNISGASDVIKFSAVTYSNEYKIKMGVGKEIIEKYTVYSKETAEEMAKTISTFTNSDYGIGITGKLNRIDKNNPFGEDNLVYVSVFEKENNRFHNLTVKAIKSTRKQNKQLVIEQIVEELEKII